MTNHSIIIDETLAYNLVAAQFPKWKHFPIWPVKSSGWDNRTFHLGEDMLIRLPSATEYAGQVETEQKWLPKLVPLLPLCIPIPLAIGQPAIGYPWNWSIYRWLPGEVAASASIINLCDFAISLAQFLIALQKIDSIDGPLPGPHNFYRGDSLKVYDSETKQAIKALEGRINTHLATKAWERALATDWANPPVWVHGDINLGNLLVQNGQLSAVIDFGQLAIGDPACDLAIAWTLFKGESRTIFHRMLPYDAGTWARARGWTLWKALIIASGLTDTNSVEGRQSFYIINEVLLIFFVVKNKSSNYT